MNEWYEIPLVGLGYEALSSAIRPSRGNELRTTDADCVIGSAAMSTSSGIPGIRASGEGGRRKSLITCL
jgi:hypothetical protein